MSEPVAHHPAGNADDAQAIERLHERTFGPGRFARSAYRIREGRGHALELSFTARIGTLLVGSVRLTPIRIGETPALLLGPLTVEPPFRSHGIGTALIARALEDAKAQGHRLVVLVGDEPFYAQVRFQAHPEGPGEDAGTGRSGAAPGRRACARRLRGRCRAGSPGLGNLASHRFDRMVSPAHGAAWWPLLSTRSHAKDILLKAKRGAVDRLEIHGVDAAIAGALKSGDGGDAVQRLRQRAISEDLAKYRHFTAWLVEHLAHAVEYGELKTLHINLDQPDAIEIDIPVLRDNRQTG